MNETFKIRKASKKTDLIDFLENGCGISIGRDGSDITMVGGASIHIIFGKTYIRIQDTKDNPREITQLFYNTQLNVEKYSSKLDDIVKSSKTRIQQALDVYNARETYVDLISKFTIANKYTYEPYTIDINPITEEFNNVFNTHNGEYIMTIESPDNFSIAIIMNLHKDLVFKPNINTKIISDLVDIEVTDHAQYVISLDSTIAKIDKLKKVVAIIINDITTLISVNI